MNIQSKEFNKQLELDVLVSGLTEITQDYVRQQFVGGMIDKLTEAIIPKGITSIKDSAFAYCIGLKRIRLPRGLTNIGVGAFWNCDRLKKVTIPASVKRIGDYAFSECNSLISVTFNGKSYDDVRSMFGYPWDLSSLKIKVEDNDKITFKKNKFDDEQFMTVYSWQFSSEETDAQLV